MKPKKPARKKVKPVSVYAITNEQGEPMAMWLRVSGRKSIPVVATFRYRKFAKMALAEKLPGQKFHIARRTIED